MVDVDRQAVSIIEGATPHNVGTGTLTFGVLRPLALRFEPQRGNYDTVTQYSRQPILYSRVAFLSFVNLRFFSSPDKNGWYFFFKVNNSGHGFFRGSTSSR